MMTVVVITGVVSAVAGVGVLIMSIVHFVERRRESV